VPRRSAGGFTIIEIVFSIAVIFLILALLLVGIHHAVKFAKGTGDRAAVTALKQGVTEFKRQFNIDPPLVNDGFGPIGTGPLKNNRSAPSVYSFEPNVPVGRNPDIVFLQTTPVVLSTNMPGASTDLRFSIYSLPYYLMGVLGKAETQNPQTDAPIDGVDGLGFCAVRRDGSFEKSGRKFQPFYDPRRADAIFSDVTRDMGNAKPGHIELRDSHKVSFRYYRWATDVATMQNPNSGNAALNVPELVGNPEEHPELRDATWAIVAAGPNGVFGDEDLLPPGPSPNGHPQWRPFAEIESAVGMSGDLSDPVYVQKVRKAAAADNVVEVGR
jgi:hypothetical protein